MAILNFDATGIETRGTFDPIPDGWYNVQIVSSDMKDSSTGGQFLYLEMEVLDGQYAGRRIFDRLNLINANPTAVEIAKQALASICEAFGMTGVGDSTELHNKPMQAKVRVRPANEKYDASNEVKGYKAISGPRPVNNAQPGAEQKPAAAAGGKPSWA